MIPKAKSERRAFRFNWAPVLQFELSELQVAGLLLVSGVVSGIAFLYSGYPYANDVWPHLARVKATIDAFRAGQLPDWNFFFYNGYPMLRFYSPLFYVLAGAIGLVVDDPFRATRICLFLLHVGSGIGCYYLARRVLADRASAFVAAFLYLFSYWHVMYVIGLGRYPVGLLFAVMPPALLLFDRMLEKPSPSRVIMAGLGNALLPLTHIFFAYFWLPFLAIWLVARMVPGGGPAGVAASWLKKTLGTIGTALVAVVVSAFFVLPFMIEGPQHRMPQPTEPQPTPSSWTVLGLSQQVSGYSGTYIGLAIVLLAVCGIILLGRERRLLRDPSFWSLLVALVLSAGTSLPFMARIPLMNELSSERFLVYLLLFAVLLAGFGFAFVRERFGAVWLWLPVVVLMYLDMAPHIFANVNRDQARLLESRSFVYDRMYGKSDGRLLDLPIEGKDLWRRFCRYPASGYLFAGTASALGEPYHQFAPRSMYYTYAWIDHISDEFLDSSREALSEQALRELRLMDAKYVVTLPTHKTSEKSVTFVFLKKGLQWDDALLRRTMEAAESDEEETDTIPVLKQPLAIGTFTDIAPVVVAPRVVRRPAFAGDSLEKFETYYIKPDWEQLVEAMELDPWTGVAQRILTLDLEDSLPRVININYEVHNVQVSATRVEFGIDVDSDCYARLAYSYYPELQVRVDGVPTQTWETADHFLLIRLRPGRHSVAVVPTTTPLRRVSGMVSLIGMLACLLGLVVGGFRAGTRGMRRNPKSQIPISNQ